MNSKSILKLLLIITSLFLFDSASSAQSDFEGKIKMKVSTDDDVSYVNYFVKDKKYRMEANQSEEGEEGAVIWDPVNKKMLMIMTSQKMYMEMPLDVSKKAEEGNWKQELKNLKFTGKTKTIHGYECKEAVYTSEDETSEIWYTQELGTFFAMSDEFAGDMPAEIKAIAENGFFPMLVVTKDNGGEEVNRMEVEEITKLSLNSDMFVPPAGFQKFDMPNMQELMKNKEN